MVQQIFVETKHDFFRKVKRADTIYDIACTILQSGMSVFKQMTLGQAYYMVRCLFPTCNIAKNADTTIMSAIRNLSRQFVCYVTPRGADLKTPSSSVILNSQPQDNAEISRLHLLLVWGALVQFKNMRRSGVHHISIDESTTRNGATIYVIRTLISPTDISIVESYKSTLSDQQENNKHIYTEGKNGYQLIKELNEIIYEDSVEKITIILSGIYTGEQKLAMALFDTAKLNDSAELVVALDDERLLNAIPQSLKNPITAHIFSDFEHCKPHVESFRRKTSDDD